MRAVAKASGFRQVFARPLPTRPQFRWHVGARLGEILEIGGGKDPDLNDARALRRVGRTRRQLFEEIDYPALRLLPVERYVFAEWKIRRAGLDYHVDYR